jgi:hypothetical protein
VRIENAVLLLALGCTQNVDGRAAWQTLARELPGAWASGEVRAHYRSISSDSVLVESFFTARGRETMTVYHLDGERLLLTHYCAQGNQPRLAAVEVSDSRALFRLLDATNVLSDQSMLVEMTLEVQPDELQRIEHYRDPTGAIEVTPMRFTRSSTAS